MAELRRDKKEPAVDLIVEEKPNLEKIVSTGSTLLDLAVSGGISGRGGIPTGIILEIFGPPSIGKTAMMTEMFSNVKHRGGRIKIVDGEGRFNLQYAQTFDLTVEEDEISRPESIEDLFREIYGFKVSEGTMGMVGGDSVAAFLAKLDVEGKGSEEMVGDAMGMARAKELHATFRKCKHKISGSNMLVVFINQLHDSGKTPGGKAIPFWSSVRIKLEKQYQNFNITEQLKMSEEIEDSKGNKKTKEITHEQIIGQNIKATVVKSSIDVPFRTAPIRYLFSHGVDDLGANLQWLKDVTGDTRYWCFDKSFARFKDAVKYVEENDYEEKVKDRVVGKWHEIQKAFADKTNRKKKKRG